MTYCIQTDIHEYTLHLSKGELHVLEKHLDRATDPILIDILKVLRVENQQSLKTGFQRIRTIRLCHKCSGSGKIRIGNLQDYSYDFEDCPLCSGLGSIVEKTTISYENITASVKEEFAR